MSLFDSPNWKGFLPLHFSSFFKTSHFSKPHHFSRPLYSIPSCLTIQYFISPTLSFPSQSFPLIRNNISIYSVSHVKNLDDILDPPLPWHLPTNLSANAVGSDPDCLFSTLWVKEGIFSPNCRDNQTHDTQPWADEIDSSFSIICTQKPRAKGQHIPGRAMQGLCSRTK